MPASWAACQPVLSPPEEPIAENEKLQEELEMKEAQWDESFRAEEQRANLQQMKQEMAALETRLARVESGGGSNQASAATGEVPKRQREKRHRRRHTPRPRAYQHNNSANHAEVEMGQGAARRQARTAGVPSQSST